VTMDVLCKVVDNYGDIGVVYRLARAISEIEPGIHLRLVVDNLESFHLLEPEVDPGAAIQTVRSWTVVNWAGPGEDTVAAYDSVYGTNPPVIVLECFACGRPDWLEAMLFDSSSDVLRTIVNLEYLSAEPYADELHRMPSLTRSQYVRKHMFMPGFTPKTGGLILDRRFLRIREHYSDPARVSEYRALLIETLGIDPGSLPVDFENCFWMLVFGYERDYSRIIEDIASFGMKSPILVFVANGKSSPCFMDSWQRAGRPFPTLPLPFLPQETWDEVLLACDCSIVRGEDSMARAALSGKPFLWQAYPQSEAHQLVKVGALLERMRHYFEPTDFMALESAFMAFNDRLVDEINVTGNECIAPFLDSNESVKQGFLSFSNALLANGNLATALMTFIREIV
jgi:uncharacterized repeat protein (TIGR03837 family)